MCIAAGVTMAAVWHLNPWLSLVPAMPLALALMVLVRLADREQMLEKREVELGSLQSLGLQLGSELEEKRLQDAVVQAAVEALKAEDAVLLLLDEPTGGVVTLARAAAGRPVPSEFTPGEVLRARFDAAEIRRIEATEEAAEVSAPFSSSATRDVLISPLRLEGGNRALLMVFRGAGRRPFDPEDGRRLASLSRFVRVALSNAQLVTDLRAMQQQLIHNEKMTALGMLVSGVAHELNNPLTSVLGYAELLLTRDQDPKRRKMLEAVASEAERAGKIVRNLLTFSRKHTPDKWASDLNGLIRQVVELRSYEHRLKGLEATIRVDPALPLVMVDPNHIQQVLLNLVTNAEHALDGRRRDGIEALEILSREDFDVLLLDLRMPGMDGTSLFEAINLSRPALARGVVFATGYASDEATREFLESAGNPVLRKPYTVESLQRIVDRIGSGFDPFSAGL